MSTLNENICLLIYTVILIFLGNFVGVMFCWRGNITTWQSFIYCHLLISAATACLICFIVMALFFKQQYERKIEMFSVGSTQKYKAPIKGEMYFQIWQDSIFQQCVLSFRKTCCIYFGAQCIEHYFFSCFQRFIAY